MRRIVPFLSVMLVCAVLVSCEPAAPPAPSPVAPATAARAGSWRAAVEAWVGGVLFPSVLGRSASGADARSWADRAVRSSPAAQARTLAGQSEARRGEVARRYAQALARTPSDAERQGWAALLSRGWTSDRLAAHLYGSAELAGRLPGAPEWLAWLYAGALDRAPDAAALAHYGAQLAAGRSRSSVASEVLRTTEAHTHASRDTFAAVVGRTPSSGELAVARGSLAAGGGDRARLRAELAAGKAPDGYRIGVVGDSVAFDLAYRVGGLPLPAVVVEGGRRPGTAGSIGCGVLASRPGYEWPAFMAPGYAPPRDGECPAEVARYEAALLATRPRVLVWQPGAWEWQSLQGPDGAVVPGRSPRMREVLAAAMVRRIDGWVAAGVRRVLLAEWACVGPLSGVVQRDPGYSRFVRSVLVEVVRRRPGAASIAPTPPQVCVGGDPAGVATAEHRRARGDQYHWVEGPHGAVWGWTYWFAPAIADLTGVR